MHTEEVPLRNQQPLQHQAMAEAAPVPPVPLLLVRCWCCVFVLSHPIRSLRSCTARPIACSQVDYL
jgi:hypothetical protein